MKATFRRENASLVASASLLNNSKGYIPGKENNAYINELLILERLQELE